MKRPKYTKFQTQLLTNTSLPSSTLLFLTPFIFCSLLFLVPPSSPQQAKKNVIPSSTTRPPFSISYQNTVKGGNDRPCTNFSSVCVLLSKMALTRRQSATKFHRYKEGKTPSFSACSALFLFLYSFRDRGAFYHQGSDEQDGAEIHVRGGNWGP